MQRILFAQVRDAVGMDRVEIALPEGGTVQDALNALSKEHQIIAAMGDRMAVAVNERYCSRGTPLEDGCTLALIPPVSGG